MATEVREPADFAKLAARIPPLVRFGTSTWNYPGWRGLVYHRDYGPKGAAAMSAVKALPVVWLTISVAEARSAPRAANSLAMAP